MPRVLVDLLGGPAGGAADYVIVDDYIADDSDEDVGLPPPPPSPTAEEEREIYRQNNGANDAHIAAKTGSLQALRVFARTDEGAQKLHLIHPHLPPSLRRDVCAKTTRAPPESHGRILFRPFRCSLFLSKAALSQRRQ